MAETKASVEPLTAALTRRLQQLRLEDASQDVRLRARLGVLDLVGVLLAGARETAPQLAARALSLNEFGQSHVFGTAYRGRAADVALVNGVSAHVLDYDDAVRGMGHPSTVVLPAVLAVAERDGATGAELLDAYVAGVEAATLVGLAAGSEHYARGFHSTGTFGTFGATAGCARLLGLNFEQTVHALGLAGSQASGLKSAFGTMTKPFHAGRAAASGVLAADLASLGFTSTPDVLEAVQGFYDTQTSSRQPSEILELPHEAEPQVATLLFKRHASCFYTHASVEAVGQAIDLHQIESSEIARVELRVPPGHLRACNITEPTSGLEGKFSLRFAVALVVLGHRALTPSLFTAESVADPTVIGIRDRVDVVADPSLTGNSCILLIECHERGPFTTDFDMAATQYFRTAAEQADELQTKFHDLADPVIGAASANRVVESVLAIESLPDIRELTQLLRGAQAPHDVTGAL